MRRETFHTPGMLTLDLRVPSGEIAIESVDGEETIVELDASGWSTQAGSYDDLQKVVDAARIELRQRGDGYEVLVDVPKRRGGLGLIFDQANFSLRVFAPHGADVQVSTASADVDGRGSFGALRAELASGDLRFAELAGQVEVKSASGDVALERVGAGAKVSTASGDMRIGFVEGEATLRSASGDVTVDEANSSVTVQTASGDQRLGAVASGRVTMQSASGDQTVGIRTGSRVRIDVRSMSGDTTSELEIEDTPALGDGPEVELRATSMSGDVRILRA
jgi:DUF4097 and DUF4098 domain-containing protein YvlB